MHYSDYALKDIADWLISPKDVSLPALQRGFVWKPYQIEALWDSIFRDYPIGAFMLTKEGEKKMIIDGQQRATAIALGFYNPWLQELKQIGNAKNLPTIWIDLTPDTVTDTHQFVFRVTTRSHPWGYQRKNNSTTLVYGDRVKASEMYMELFGVDTYTKLSPKQRIPYDASVPVPLCFLLDAYLKVMNSGSGESRPDAWWRAVVDFCKEGIPAQYRSASMGKSSSGYYAILERIDYYPWYSIVEKIFKEYRVHAIMVENNLILTPDDNASENPTLFVRLNRGGTPLEGEELLYSIYKAAYPLAKDLVENMGCGIIAPSRLITLASRLALSQISGRYYKNLSLTQFQKEIGDKDFRARLESFIGKKEDSPLGKMVKTAIDILRGDERSAVPDVIVKRFIRECPNGLLLILSWLSSNSIGTLTPDIKKAICSKLYRLYWFGDLNDYAARTWPQSTDPDYWQQSVFNYGGYTMHPLVNPAVLESFLLSRLENPVEDHGITPSDSEIWNLWSSSLTRPEGMTDESFNEAVRGGWANFLWRLLSGRSRDLILLAQRDYIHREFKDFNQLEDLQDTNTPWDWDHIYPSSWVYYQRDIDQRTKNWEWRLGNFRAMSLVDNRSENNGANAAPAVRFTSPSLDYFIKDNDLTFWRRLTGYEKDASFVITHASAIIIRTVNIYREFLDYFSIKQ